MDTKQEVSFSEFEERVFPGLPEVMEKNLRSKFDTGERMDEFIAERIEEDLPGAIQSEREFSRQVFEVCARWANERDSIVLWDVDETMGKYLFGPDGKPRWGFRPVLLPLFEFLQEKFPGLRHGILSSRGDIQDQLNDPEHLQRISRFIDPEHVYSSRGKYVPSQVENAYHEKGQEQGIYNITPEKAEILRELRESGKNVKDIDDDGVAALAEKDGLCVYAVWPNEYFCG